MGLIDDIAALAPVAETPSPKSRILTYGLKIPGASNTNGSSRLLVDTWLRDRGVAYTIKKFGDGRTGYLLAQCPFDTAHGGSGEVMVAQDVSGAMSARCMHNSCSGRGWQEFKAAIGPPDPHHYDPPYTRSRPADAQQVEDQPASQVPEEQVERPKVRSIRELVQAFPELRRPSFHGLLRVGETLNCIAPPKVGKSWLACDMALSKATGRPWLGRFDVEPGLVVVFDNELHSETSAHRLPKVAEARGIPFADYADRIRVVNLRGCLCDVLGFGEIFSQFAPQELEGALIIVDAFYRAMPRGMSENDNASMAQVYNAIDHYAMTMNCSFELIHHSSKGDQSSKSVTDVGSGAGSQARATDSHLILRRHAEEGHYVLECAVRSWKPVEPLVLQWQWPLWHVATGKDPTRLKSDRVSPADRLAEVKDDILKALIFHPDGATKRSIQERTGRPNCWLKALSELLDEGLVVECEVRNPTHKKTDQGYQRVYTNDDDF